MKKYVSSVPLPDFNLWDKIEGKRALLSFDLELTDRCNLDCRHCYINKPAGDKEARAEELSFEEIQRISDEAVELGALWCLITGGEPLLREDFIDIYMDLKKKGLLLSVFTNATLITDEHIRLFQKYPPRDVEVTVYGVTKETLEKITRKPGSFETFRKGLDSLLSSDVNVRLKAMALRSNAHELSAIAQFCRERTKDYYRFDPFLHLRFDRNAERNKEIISERLSPGEIAEAEKQDPERFRSLEKECDKIGLTNRPKTDCAPIFYCTAAYNSFVLSANGQFRLCSSLYHPGCMADLRKRSLKDAWENLVKEVMKRTSREKDFLEKCFDCPLVNICMWCPALAYLETGELDAWVDYFCELAHTRAEQALKTESGKKA